jgi:hypothetical protein
MQKKIAVLLILFMVGSWCLFAEGEGETDAKTENDKAVEAAAMALTSGDSGWIIVGVVLVGLLVAAAIVVPLSSMADAPGDALQLANAGIPIGQTAFSLCPEFNVFPDDKVYVGLRFKLGAAANNRTGPRGNTAPARIVR